MSIEITDDGDVLFGDFSMKELEEKLQEVNTLISEVKQLRKEIKELKELQLKKSKSNK